MTTELPTFSSAFTGACNLPAVYLLGRCDDGPLTEHQTRRQIERWQTKALARELLEAWGVTTAYQLEKELVALEPSMVFPDERPRLFDRMLAKGEPGIAKELAKSNSLSAFWVGKALIRAPRALDILSDQVWRLLDPTPMSHIEWAIISEAIMPRVADWMLKGGKPDDLILHSPLYPDSKTMMEYFISRTEPSSLWGFLLLLLQLRWWELNGILVAYYLELLEAFERCMQPSPSPELAVLMPECAGFLAAVFGRVHICPTNAGNVKLQLQRISTARQTFEGVRGALQSPTPEIVLK